MKNNIVLAVLFLFHVAMSLQAQNSEEALILWKNIQFESPYEYISIDSSSQNIWQIGQPQKDFFDAPFSANQAIVTDTIDSYPTNNHSYFDLYLGAFNYEDFYPYDIFIELKHKYDTDLKKDGGYLTISYDNGDTWANIIEDDVFDCCGIGPEYANENLYWETDTLFNGEKGFSGKSDGWVSTWFAWHFLPVKSEEEIGDTMILRFNFISDDIDNQKEGWMIDDIILYSVDLGSDIEDFEASNLVDIYPNPMRLNTVLDLRKNVGEIAVEVVDLKGKSVFNQKYFNKSSLTLDTDNLLSGVYFVKIRMDRERPIVRKLVVE